MPPVFALLIALVWPDMPVRAASPDWQTYDAVLRAHVQRRTVAGISTAWVNYTGLRADARWPQVVRTVAEFDVSRLNTREEKLAFYINAYNILVLDLIVRSGPVADINRLGTAADPIWKRPVGVVGRKRFSLDALENDVIRRFGEPRIHFALNCAALSCPDLRAGAYTAMGLSAQLTAQTGAFLNHAGKGVRVGKDKKSVSVSKIFEWFAADFGDVPAFVRKYRRDLPPAVRIQTDLEYDWRLNGA